MTIRVARREELDSLSDLARRSKAHWGYSEEFMRDCHDELNVPESLLPDVYVSELDGAVAGFHALGFDGSGVELEFLFVDPPAMRRGVGRELLSHARTVAGRRGYRVMTIQGDPNAGPFYLAAGAREVGTRESTSIPGRLLPLYEIDCRQL